MVATAMKERGTSVRQLADQLGVTEGVLRYRLKKLGEEGAEAPDGHAQQAMALDGYDAVRAIQERREDGRLSGEGRPCPVQLRGAGPGSRLPGQLQGGGSAPPAALWDAQGPSDPAGGDSARGAG